jgi:predicted  nucleic acid-binding Zn-ribbon protein
MESTDAAASSTTRTIEQWIGQSQEVLTGAIPALLRECEALRRRADSAEEQSQRLSRENDDLQDEITKFRRDVEALTRQRSEMAAAVAELRRFTNEALFKLSG